MLDQVDDYCDREIDLLTDQIDLLKSDGMATINAEYIRNDESAIITLKRVKNKLTWLDESVNKD
jgi:hypothetical protein